MIRPLSRAASLAGLVCGLSLSQQAQTSSFVKPWGHFDGKQVYLYTLKNATGAEVKITNYGGTVTSIAVKDHSGKFGDVVLGFPQLSGYTAKPNTAFFGATIGRYANRLGGGKFTLDGKAYQIFQNDSGNTLHGGKRGFDKRVWDATSVPSAGNPSLTLHRVSPDGEEAFPGNLDVTVTFTLSDNNELKIEYAATTDKDTVLNLANHSYFNLSGPGSGTILGDILTITADSYTPVTKDLIPTGEIAPVEGTPFDFRKPTKIGEHLGEQNEQLKFANGYDQNFVLNRSGDGLELAARVEDPKSGRILEVLTTQPGVQFYTGNFLDGANVGVGGPYKFRSALCLETQHYPDSPNHANFPSAELKAGDKFSSTTVYRFSTN